MHTTPWKIASPSSALPCLIRHSIPAPHMGSRLRSILSFYVTARSW